MFIVSLTYLCEMDEIENHLSSHIAYLDRHYAAGHFLASGRKNPRTGGIILANVESAHVLDGIIAEDPFKINNLAHYEMIEFIPSKVAPPLAFLL